MRTIVVAGARSGIGKTRLSQEILALLPDAVHVKIGHGEKKPSLDNCYYSHGTPWSTVRRDHADRACVVIESNSILTELTPDLAIYLAAENPKPSAFIAMRKAQVVSGMPIEPAVVDSLAAALDLDHRTVRRICRLAGARPGPAAAIILAGGRSARMGRNKALLTVNGKTLLQRIHVSLAPWFDEIILSTATTGDISLPGTRIVRDMEPDKGPLMGIYSAVSASTCPINFVLACDIPDLNLHLVRKLLAASEEADIALPSFREGQFEPLFAVYTKAILPHAKQALAQGRLRIASLFKTCRVQLLNISADSWYVNLNTQHDYVAYTQGQGEIAP